jgi:hypothetical protein
MKKMHVIAVLGLIAVVFSTGCGRARATTEVRSDGSYVRSIEFSGQGKQEGGMQGPSLADTFLFPAGVAWKVTDEKGEKNAITKTFTRTFAAGAVSKGDLWIKDGATSDKPKLVNEVAVTMVGPKRFEYKETIRWTGTPAKTTELGVQEIEEIKALLPKELATDENARGIAKRTVALVVPMLFGPSDPLLASSFIHPELAVRKAKQKMGAVIMKAMEEQFGDKLTADQRRELALRLIEKSVSSSKPSQPDPTSMGEGTSKDSTGMIPLTFVVKCPGRLISSNGEYDGLSKEVYWAMFPEGASMQPVVLTAVCELP